MRRYGSLIKINPYGSQFLLKIDSHDTMPSHSILHALKSPSSPNQFISTRMLKYFSNTENQVYCDAVSHSTHLYLNS